MPIGPLEIATFGLSLFGAKKSYDYQKAAAEKAEKVGKLEGRQFVNELFLAKAQAIGAANRRREELTQSESANLAMFGKMERDDRSVDAFLKRNQDIAAADIAEIDRKSEILSAKYATQAAVAYTYGQNTAAGMRTQATANLFTNLADIAQNLGPSLVKPKRGGGGGGK
jgi:hypothetical protein